MSPRSEMVQLLGQLKDEAVAALRVVARLQVLLEEEQLAQVSRARKAGNDWKEIAAALGVTRQAVHKRFFRMV